MDIPKIHYGKAKEKPTPTQESRHYIHETIESVGYLKPKPTFKMKVERVLGNIAASQPDKSKEKPLSFLIEGIKRSQEKKKGFAWARIGMNQRW